MKKRSSAFSAIEALIYSAAHEAPISFAARYHFSSAFAEPIPNGSVAHVRLQLMSVRSSCLSTAHIWTSVLEIKAVKASFLHSVFGVPPVKA